MRKIKRVSLSLFVALLVALSITTIAYAVYGYVSEQSAGFTSSGLSAAPCGTCQDGNAKRGTQSLFYTNTTRWGQWATSTDNVDQWWTYIPNIAGDFAGVRYSIGNPVGELYYTTVNQNNWKGSYVNLGTFSLNSTSAWMYLPNRCVTGYACDGRYLYFDKSRYAY